MLRRCRNISLCLAVVGFLVSATRALAADTDGPKAPLSGPPASQESAAAQSAAPAVATTEKLPPAAANAAPVEAAGVKQSDGKSPSLLQLLEAHEAEVKRALAVAGVAFVLGWVCGAFYSVRRERKHRRRLRL